MCKDIHNDENGAVNSYDIEIESELYHNDYDDVYTMIDEQTKEETDIQFE